MSSAKHNYKIIKPDNDVDKILFDYFLSSFRDGYVEVGEDKYTLPTDYLKYRNGYDNFEVKNGDVFLASHPKTGTTWLQEMMWLIENNVDFEGAKEALPKRFPFLELTMLFDYTSPMKNNPEFLPPDTILDSLAFANNIKSPRLIKTHFPWSLLPTQIRNNEKQPKIIYVLRNPKDTCVSYYHHCRLFEGYKGNLEDFCKLFLAGRVTYGPFWKHVLSYWKKRDQPNLLILTYEEMKEDLPSIIRRVAKFLDKKLTNEQINQLNKHLSFESMKNNPAVNYEDFTQMTKEFKFTEDVGNFMRSGTVGNYRTKLSPKMIKKFDVWTRENLKGIEFLFEKSMI